MSYLAQVYTDEACFTRRSAGRAVLLFYCTIISNSGFFNVFVGFLHTLSSPPWVFMGLLYHDDILMIILAMILKYSICIP